MSVRTTLRVALIGAGAAGQAHAFGCRNVSMAAGLEVSRSTWRSSSTRTSSSPRTADRYGYTDATADLQPCWTIQASMQSASRYPIACTPRCYRRYCVGQACADRKADRPQRHRGRWTRARPNSPARSPASGSLSGGCLVWPRCTTWSPTARSATSRASPPGTTPTTAPRPTHRSAGDTRRRPQAPAR